MGLRFHTVGNERGNKDPENKDREEGNRGKNDTGDQIRTEIRREETGCRGKDELCAERRSTRRYRRSKKKGGASGRKLSYRRRNNNNTRQETIEGKNRGEEKKKRSHREIKTWTVEREQMYMIGGWGGTRTQRTERG